jgi:hypothetical protein
LFTIELVSLLLKHDRIRELGIDWGFNRMNGRCWFVAIFLFLLSGLVTGSANAQAGPQPVVRAVLFHSPSCSHCHYVIQEILPPLHEKYGDQFQLIGIDVSQPGGQQFYQAAVAHFKISESRRGVPALIIGDVVLVGSGEIPAQLPVLIENWLANGGIDWPAVPGLREALAASAPAEQPSPTPQATPTPEQQSTAVALAGGATPIYMAYFHDPNCLDCRRVNAELDVLQSQFPQLVVRKYNVFEEAALNEIMGEKYGVPADQRLIAPAIFVGDLSLASDEISNARLLSLIANPPAAAASPPWEGLEVVPDVASARIVERFQQFSVLAVIGAGLLDGVNPCAFTTMIFFVSYLTLVGRRGREILMVGGSFTLAVFLTYLVLGLGLVEVIRQVESFATIGIILYGVTALICLVLAALSLWDYIQIRRGKLTEIALQLPKSLKKRIHSTIRTSSRTSGFVAAAFGAGILVSIFELACTGQVYLPTIVFVTGISEMRSVAVAYLVLYNIMFVVPLIAVFTVTYWGTSSQQLTAIFQSRAGLVKLFTAGLFTVLGVWLAYMVYVIT